MSSFFVSARILPLCTIQKSFASSSKRVEMDASNEPTLEFSVKVSNRSVVSSSSTLHAVYCQAASSQLKICLLNIQKHQLVLMATHVFDRRASRLLNYCFEQDHLVEGVEPRIQGKVQFF